MNRYNAPNYKNAAVRGDRAMIKIAVCLRRMTE